MDRYDVLLLMGMLALAVGCGLIYFPLGLIAGGAGCIAIAVLGARTQAAPEKNKVATSGKEKAKA